MEPASRGDHHENVDQHPPNDEIKYNEKKASRLRRCTRKRLNCKHKKADDDKQDNLAWQRLFNRMNRLEKVLEDLYREKCTRDTAPKEESVSMACYTGNIPTVLDRSQYINQWLEELYPTPQPNR